VPQGRDGIGMTIVGVEAGLKQKIAVALPKSMLRCTFQRQNLQN
jgi:hypothetical protein